MNLCEKCANRGYKDDRYRSPFCKLDKTRLEKFSTTGGCCDYKLHDRFVEKKSEGGNRGYGDGNVVR